MKIIKKVILSIIINIILMMLPIKALAWLPYNVYDACNKVNLCISVMLIIVAVIIAITYITSAILYMKKSQKGKSEKIKNVRKWLIITIIQIAVLILGAFGVKKIGMEWYWHPTGERYQFNEIDGYISNSIRIVALMTIIVYIITASIYFFRSKKEEGRKIINLTKWQIITATIVASLLLLATNW